METSANRAHVRPSARNRLTASRRPGSHGWSSANDAGLEHPLQTAARLVGRRHQLGDQPGSASVVVHDPRGVRLQHGREPGRPCRRGHRRRLEERDALRDLDPQFARQSERPLLAERDVQRRVGTERKRALAGEILGAGEHLDGAVMSGSTIVAPVRSTNRRTASTKPDASRSKSARSPTSSTSESGRSRRGQRLTRRRQHRPTFPAARRRACR